MMQNAEISVVIEARSQRDISKEMNIEKNATQLTPLVAHSG